nr:hypothetical protein GCM10020092_026720 [Actinoplanes digitatis]
MPGAPADQDGGDGVQVAVRLLDVAETDPEAAPGEQQLDRVRAGRSVAHRCLEHPLGLGPVADPEKPVRGDRQQPGLVGAAQADLGQLRGAPARDEHALLDAVQRPGEQLGQVQVGAADVVRVPRALGDLHRLPDHREPGVGVLAEGQAEAERRAGAYQVRGRAVGAFGQLEGLTGADTGVGVAAQVQQQLGQVRRRACLLLLRARLRCERPFVLDLGGGRPTGRRQVAGPAQVDLALAGAVRACGQLLDAGQGTLVLAAAVRGLGGVRQQLGALRRVVAGQLEGEGPLAVRLGVAVHPLGVVCGGDDRRQRAFGLARLPPVVCQPGVVRPARRGLQRLRVAAVPGRALGRQHLVLEDLGDDPVAQPVAVVGAGHEAVRDRGPDRLDQLGLGQRQHPGEQGVLDRLDAGRDRVHHLVRVRGQLVDAGEEDLAQRVGELDPAVAQVAGQLLDDERVAAAALEDPLGVLGRDVRPGDRGHQLTGRVAVERGQVQHAYGAQPAQLGQHPA